MQRGELLYEDFTYKLRGIFYNIQNEIGQYSNVNQYGDLLEDELKRSSIEYRREFVLAKSFEAERSNRNRVDFIVKENNIFIIIELKTTHTFSRDNYYQCQRYLNALNLDLALLVTFRPKYVMVKRVLNVEKYKKQKIN